ncbi:Transmembrane protein 163 [Apodemus speciosus]|uniref:Transmembrane protein 163 n=1 Tax=Apodemus speciosus TaxID=105296 RepID=A0ABQ0EE62_APOSI
MEPAPGSERRSPPGPGVPRPPPRGHAPSTAAPAPSAAPTSSSVQPDEERQPRISESGQFSDGLEDRGLLESSTRLKPHEAQNYRKKALWVSWLSIIVTLALAVAAFRTVDAGCLVQEISYDKGQTSVPEAVSVMRYSASAFGFAFDAILDVLSSAIVLWRYSNAAAVHSAHREYIACVILGVIFLLSSICIVVKAIHDLSTRLLPEVDDFLFSRFNSLVGGVMGFSILLSAEVFKHNAAVWYLDGSIGVLIGLTIFAYGVKLLIDMVPRVRQTRHYEMFE